MKVKLGDRVKDKVTGFEGTAIGHADYLTGCDQFLLQPNCEIGKEHSKPDGEWIDEGRLVVLKKELTKKDVQANKNGCDISAPIK